MTSTASQGEGLDAKKIDEIQAGATTRKQVIEWFGPPNALLHKGDSKEVSGLEKSRVLRFDEQFLLFADTVKSSDDQAIFFYERWTQSASGGMVLFVGANSVKMKYDRLWLLVRESDGVVLGKVHRQE